MDIREIKNDLKLFREDYLEFKTEVRQSLYHFKSKGPDASTYFPVQDNKIIEKFMCKDEDFEKRKQVLYHLMMECEADSQRKFTDSFLTTIFSKQYLATHIWPCGR